MSMYNGYQATLITGVPAVISASGTTSAAISMNGFSLVGITTPAAFTGTTLTFTTSTTLAGTYVPVNSTSGTAVSYTVTTSNYYAIEPKDFYGCAFIKIVSGSTEGSARTLVCSIKGIQMVIADFRADFPEFADTAVYPDAQLTFWATIAENQLIECRWGNIWPQAVMLYVAHEVTLSATAKAAADAGGVPGQNGGIQTSKQVGNVSVGYDASSISEKDAGWWNLTNYGKQLFHLIRLYGAGCVQIPSSGWAGGFSWWQR